MSWCFSFLESTGLDTLGGHRIFARVLAGSLPRPPLRSGLLRAPAKTRVNRYLKTDCNFPLLFRLSSLLNRRGQVKQTQGGPPEFFVIFLAAAVAVIFRGHRSFS